MFSRADRASDPCRNIGNKLNLVGKAEMRVLAAQLGLVPWE
ncbi:MAG: hypothetical protein ACETWR_13840 [Anaerolineae bacterium]